MSKVLAVTSSVEPRGWFRRAAPRRRRNSHYQSDYEKEHMKWDASTKYARRAVVTSCLKRIRASASVGALSDVTAAGWV